MAVRLPEVDDVPFERDTGVSEEEILECIAELESYDVGDLSILVLHSWAIHAVSILYRLTGCEPLDFLNSEKHSD